jgi:hypothetical protein
LATFDDVKRIALALPETAEAVSRGNRHWRVKDKLFVWERPLRRTDLEALGDSAPDGPVLGARVEHLGAKEALLADDPDVYFTTPHFDGYPAVLVQRPDRGRRARGPDRRRGARARADAARRRLRGEPRRRLTAVATPPPSEPG